ncbi:MAG: META domain-containing protein, partial [Bacteroidales bacterium]|nr:META domain-containing protein [Bacteroidales bacterium]
DPDKANSVQFQNLISTRMMCPDVAGETSLLIALEETYYSLKVDDNTIVFKNKYGEELIRLERLDLNK